MPNLTATTLRGAPVENIAIPSAPRAHEVPEGIPLKHTLIPDEISLNHTSIPEGILLDPIKNSDIPHHHLLQNYYCFA